MTPRRVRGHLHASFAILFLVCFSSGEAVASEHEPLRFVQTIALDGVEGRIDHMAVDPHGRRLFVAALGNGTVEVIDLRAGKRVRSLRGFREPQGVGFVASPPRLFVANGGDGSCDVLDARTFARIRKLRLSGDADNVRFDSRTGRVYVGYGAGAIRVLDPATGDSLGDIMLPAHPEGFQLETGGARGFVNVPDEAEVAIVDGTRGGMVGKRTIGGFAANYPMALDETAHRLFVGCRRPSAVLVFDDRTGRRVADVSIDRDVDDLLYDPSTRELFASCGAGFIDVLGTGITGEFGKIAKIVTAPGARTALYEPGQRRLYLAVPHRGAQPAEIRVFESSKEWGTPTARRNIR